MKTEKNFSVRPAKRRAAPKYPTMAEIGVADLSRVPARWQRLHTVAAALGTAAMSLKAIALGSEGDGCAAPRTDGLVRAVEDNRPYLPNLPNLPNPRPVTDVAPIPPAALAGDGAGAFGCIAMNPPVMLPESEALSIIEREFLKRGIKLVESPTLDGVLVPGQSRLVRSEDGNYERRVAFHNGNYCGITDIAETDERRDVTLDFGTVDGSIMVEYVSEDDEDRFKPYPRIISTARSVDTREMAERLAKGFAARTEGKSVRVGVFYDPCARVPEEWEPSEEAVAKAMAGKDDDWFPRWELRRAEGRRLAEEKLVAQIEEFFKHIGNEKPGK